MALSWQPIISVDDITQEQWQQLSDHRAEFSSPFLSYQYLKGLESTACVNGKTGWHSYHIGVFSKGNKELFDSRSNDSDELIAFIPCYLKTHSYGEYIFDHAWANAYQQHQIPYYPKLVACIPFTPVTGSRMLIKNNSEHTFDQINRFIVNSKDHILREARASSLHILFIPEYQSNLLIADSPLADSPVTDQLIATESIVKRLLQRLSVQFIWRNRDYTCFDDFMQQMTSRKRRSIKKERANALLGSSLKKDAIGGEDITGDGRADQAAVAERAFCENAPANKIDVKRLTGEQITPSVMADFYLCYQQTYLKRSGHTGYLTDAFFEFLRTEMHTNIMIVMAYTEGNCIAAALFFYNEEQLYGRYWGALHEVSGLHFECCYYQGIEFAIEKKLRQFNPGTQGEHKILRGFEPTFCYSNHYLQHPGFQKAVADFLEHERIGIEQYKQHGESVLPFKNTDGK